VLFVCLLAQSLVRKRRDKGGLFKIDRRRQLILTTKPRIIYLDPETSVPTVKGEVRACESVVCVLRLAAVTNLHVCRGFRAPTLLPLLRKAACV
jgi:hypothetical protein